MLKKLNWIIFFFKYSIVQTVNNTEFYHFLILKKTKNLLIWTKKTFSYNENEQTRSRSSQLSMFNSLLQHFFEAIFFLLYIKCILSSFTNEWQRQYFCNGKVNDVIIAVCHMCLEEQFNSKKNRDWVIKSWTEPKSMLLLKNPQF